jgi:uncharacterized protein
MHLVTLASVTPQPWRNGGGLTRDLLAWPDAVAWQCRISVADVERSGPFSAYPGVDRCFTVLQGAGVVLHLPGGPRRLTACSAPLAFDGAATPGCDLVDGATLDLNLMVQRDAGSGGMQQAGAVAWVHEAPLRALFCAEPAVLRVAGQPALELPAMSLAWTAQSAGEAWRCVKKEPLAGYQGDAPGTPPQPRAWWLHFHPRTS